MVTIELAEEEATLLKERLETLLSDIRMELADTDRADFRDGLKREKTALEHAISQLQGHWD